jgi:hypothetical protein
MYVVGAFQRKILTITEEFNEGDSEYKQYPVSFALLMVVGEEMAYEDVAWSLGSILFVVSYMTFHLGSFFLASMGML